MLKLATALALATIAPVGAPLMAADRSPVASVHVVTADLDLAGPAGIRALDRRLSAAIHHACPAPFAADLRGALDHRSCLVTARRTAREGRALVLAQASVARVQLAGGAR